MCHYQNFRSGTLGQLYSGKVQSGLLDLLDGTMMYYNLDSLISVQLSQPVRDGPAPVFHGCPPVVFLGSLELMSLGTWQRDFMAKSYSNKKMSIEPGTSQRDVDRRIHALKNWSRPIVERCRYTTVFKHHFKDKLPGILSASRWTVRVLPWVVGAGCLVHEQLLRLNTLKFLGIPGQLNNGHLLYRVKCK